MIFITDIKFFRNFSKDNRGYNHSIMGSITEMFIRRGWDWKEQCEIFCKFWMVSTCLDDYFFCSLSWPQVIILFHAKKMYKIPIVHLQCLLIALNYSTGNFSNKESHVMDNEGLAEERILKFLYSQTPSPKPHESKTIQQQQ